MVLLCKFARSGPRLSVKLGSERHIFVWNVPICAKLEAITGMKVMV